MKPHVITEVVEKDLCCSCGVCAGVCPTNALTMQIYDNGDLAPVICQSACDLRPNCRLCLLVCPTASGILDPRPRNEELFGPGQNPAAILHEDIGWHIQSLAGWRVDGGLRTSSASGGLLTWCLEQLLESGAVTRVACIRMAGNPGKGMFEFYPASTIEEVRKSAGSIYQPVEFSGILKELGRDRTQRWAVVGVPCLCAGIRSVKQVAKQVPYVLGLACGMYQNIFYTEALLKKSGADAQDISRIDFRLSPASGSASNFGFRAKINGGAGKTVPYHGLPHFLGKNAYFRLNACNFCKDVFAETADACFMDAWLPEYMNEYRGTSLVVIRNPQINEIFSHSEGFAKDVFLENIDSEKVAASQAGHVRRKRTNLPLRLASPRRSLLSGSLREKRDRIHWRMQQITQKRSKRAWRRLGRQYGSWAFWAAMIDVWLAQHLLSALDKAASIPRKAKRAISRARPAHSTDKPS